MHFTVIKSFLLKNIDSIIAALAGFILVLFLTYPNGVGISPDSIVYTGTARKLATDHTLNTYNDSPLVDFPAFYPIFLAAIISCFKQDIIVIAPFVNATLFALVIFFSGVVLNKGQYNSTWYKRLLLLFTVTSISLLPVYFMLWSETLFILLTVLFFIAIHKYFATHLYKHLFLAALVAALSCVTRYAGITLIATGCSLLLFDPQLKLIKKLLKLLFFGVIGSSLLAINLLRNFSAKGSLTGGRLKSITPFLKNIYLFGKVILSWFSSFNINYSITVFTGLFILLVFYFLFIKFILKKVNYYSYENIVIVFFVAYASFIILSSTLSRYDPIDNRLLSPLFIPLLWVCTSWLNGLINNDQIKKRTWIIYLVILIAAGFEINQLSAIPKVPYQRSFSDATWRNSTIVKFLKENNKIFKKDYTIYSNVNPAVYFFTGCGSDPLPLKNSNEDIKDFYEEENIYLVWFNKSTDKEHLSFNEILKNKPMTLIQRFADGSIYVYDENK